MARTWAIITVCAFMIAGNQQYFQAHADDRYMQKYAAIVESLEPMVDWNDTLGQLPGYECYSNRPLDLPPLGEELVFPCDVLPPSNQVPTTAHRVRPSDIKVVGAMGDSLTAANGAGACFLPELLYMYRGQVFSHGGDKSFETNPTLANILRKFNPALKGFGVETGNWDSIESGMNVGYPGDIAADMPHQARWLVQKMRANPDIDFDNDWKLVTLLIGGNDLCDWCDKPDYYTPEQYVSHINEALMTLKNELPRTIVNIVGVLQVDQINVLRAPICDVFHWAFCSCALGLTPDELAHFQAITKEYQTQMEDAIMSGRYDGKDDFTVVLQPFLHETTMPFMEDGSPDFSYFAPDCFHFSAKGHSQGGIELWKNMFEPVGAKTTAWTPGNVTITCPTEESPYIYTNLNSRNPPVYANPTPPPSRAASRLGLVGWDRLVAMLMTMLVLALL